MDEAKQEIHNQGSVFGQVGTNTGTIIQNFLQKADTIIPSLPESIWTVPYPHNPFFTAREDLLSQLHKNLLAEKTVALTQPQAINGLGGIGKTQIAVEYAHRYRRNYPYVFWINAATTETLFIDFITLAKLLGLPIFHETDQKIIITFVKNWLDTHSGWLLIIDNADDLELARNFLPTKNTNHIIFTTREQIVSPFVSLEVQKMNRVESTLMLLRRANLLDTASDKDKEKAEAIAKEMDGLPLALDQAGAYIEEMGCTVEEYLERYKQQQLKYLQRRGRNSSYHNDPIATTWSLSFTQIEQRLPIAADVLRCCAFLAPDDIPEEFFRGGANELNSPLQPIEHDPSLLDEAIGELRHFSLVRRNQIDRTFSIHRLVQAILRTNMAETTQHVCAERAVHIVNQAFPENIDITTWKHCQRYATHAQMCANFIKEYHLTFPETATLLNKTAYYLGDIALYPEAEPLFQQALQIREQVLGPDHPSTATTMDQLASLYLEQGRYAEAESLFLHALTIHQEREGPEHPNTADTMHELGRLYLAQGRYAETEPLYRHALDIYQKTKGSEHPSTAITLHELGRLYLEQGRYPEAEPLLLDALTIHQEREGPEHPNTASTMLALASLYHAQDRYSEAEPLYRHALNISQKTEGSEHPSAGVILHELGRLYLEQGRYAEAEPLYRHALNISQEVLGPEHPNTASTMHELGRLYLEQGRYAEAEPLFLHALRIHQEMEGPEHPNTAITMHVLGRLYFGQGRYTEAEPFFLQALSILQKALGPEHPHTTNPMHELGRLYFEQGRYAEAEPLFLHALTIRQKALGPEHSSTKKAYLSYHQLLTGR